MQTMKNDIEIAVEQNTIISKKVQKYATHKKAVWKSSFLNFIVADPELLQHSFCNSGLCKIARKNYGQLEKDAKAGRAED